MSTDYTRRKTKDRSITLSHPWSDMERKISRSNKETYPGIILEINRSSRGEPRFVRNSESGET